MSTYSVMKGQSLYMPSVLTNVYVCTSKSKCIMFRVSTFWLLKWKVWSIYYVGGSLTKLCGI